jgi:hypothetical protein
VRAFQPFIARIRALLERRSSCSFYIKLKGEFVKNAKAEALAFKRLMGRKRRAQELGISSKTTDEEIIEMAREIAKKKIEAGDTRPLEEVEEGQLLYLEGLRDMFRGTPEEALEREYVSALAELEGAEDDRKALLAEGWE